MLTNDESVKARALLFAPFQLGPGAVCRPRYDEERCPTCGGPMMRLERHTICLAAAAEAKRWMDGIETAEALTAAQAELDRIPWPEGRLTPGQSAYSRVVIDGIAIPF